MSGYVVLKSSKTDDGWEHEAIAWCAWEDAANSIVEREGKPFSVRYGYVKYSVIETDMEPWIDACIGDGSYVGGIGGVFYIDESTLDL